MGDGLVYVSKIFSVAIDMHKKKKTGTRIIFSEFDVDAVFDSRGVP